MEEGSLRCDANISLRPVGTLKFGTRTEIKNINSFKFVERALEYEIVRQMAVLKSGKEVQQETLLFDSAQGVTRPMRSKEESADYRYFPDPDLPPLVIAESWVEEIRSKLPKLPEQRLKELCEVYGLSTYDAAILTAERACADYFEAVFKVCNNAKAACNWVTSELFGALNKQSLDITNSPVSAQHLGELIMLVEGDTISGKMAKSVFEEMFATSQSPRAIVEAKGLQQVTDDGAILGIIRQVFEQNKTQATEFIGGNDRLHAFFVGQTMKLSKGSANPKKVNELITAEVTRLRGK
jgi:aspartyl-tRNA(Asn)/glutamyl-tRNA(Gln) amidotransferase subunit B